MTAFAIDGDTLNCLLDRGWNDMSQRKLRVEGVQAPELNSKNELERQAAAAVKLCADAWGRRHLGDGVRLLSKKWDKYANRVLGDLVARPSMQLTGPFDALNAESLKHFLLSCGLGKRWNGEGKCEWLELELRGILDRAEAIASGKPFRPGDEMIPPANAEVKP